MQRKGMLFPISIPKLTKAAALPQIDRMLPVIPDLDAFIQQLCQKGRHRVENGKELVLVDYLNPCGAMHLARDLQNHYTPTKQKATDPFSMRQAYALLKRHLPAETFRGNPRIAYISGLTLEKFLRIEQMLVEHPFGYPGVGGMIAMADELAREENPVNLGDLYGGYVVLRDAKIVGELGWRRIELAYDAYKKLERMYREDPREFMKKDNRLLAAEAGTKMVREIANIKRMAAAGLFG